MPLNSDHLKQFIAEHALSAELLILTADTPTVASAAAVLQVTPDQIIKSVLFRTHQEPVLVIACGLSRIDYRKLADYLGISRRQVSIASADEVLAITGYVAGSVPPFGHLQKLRTVVETAVLAQSHVYGGGGEVHALMHLSTAELQKVVGMETAVLSQ